MASAAFSCTACARRTITCSPRTCPASTRFDFNFSQQGVKRWGFYAACSDHIASDYNKHGGGPLPDGTGVIGLLLIKKGAGAGAYEHYHLGSGRATYGYRVNDAYAVHDQMLWLPIGLAYAH